MNDPISKAIFGATLKIKRANRHINELKSAIENLADVEGQGTTIVNDGDDSKIIGFTSTGDLGTEISLILGDAIHNLRASLDHVWMGLWSASSQGGFGYFPFHETRKNLEDAIGKSPVKVAFPHVEKLILEKVKPHGTVMEIESSGRSRSLTRLTNTTSSFHPFPE